MNWILRAVAAISIAASPLAAQTGAAPATAVAFEVADVHASHPSPTRNGAEFHSTQHGDRYSLRDATMVDLIATAYDVDPANISGGPPWVQYDRFDIFAKSAGAPTHETRRTMLRALLAERFHLAVHTAVKPLPAFVLSTINGKAPKLKQAGSAGEGGHEGCEYLPAPKDAPPEARRNVKFSCHATTMEELAEFLHDVGTPYMTRPVVDSTGLKGAWDFDLEWTWEPPSAGSGGVTLFAAVDKQLGLKLEAGSAKQTVVAIDSVDRKPTANVAEIEKLLPPPPAAAFDVAVIRPNNPAEKNFNVDINGASVEIQFATLQTLIGFAWEINVGKIANKSKFLDVQHFDIAGKATVDAPPDRPMARPELDLDDVKGMLRTLLMERFKLAVHMEEQPVQAYTLVAVAPTMKAADPANHPSCKEGPGADGKDPRRDNPVLSRLISCQNMTMAQLAEELQTLASGYFAGPLIDATGLTGGYDFSISFSRQKDLAGTAAPIADGSGSSEPSGAISLFDAINRQLGLKVEKKDKVNVPMLVIDHVEAMPTEN